MNSNKVIEEVKATKKTNQEGQKDGSGWGCGWGDGSGLGSGYGFKSIILAGQVASELTASLT